MSFCKDCPHWHHGVVQKNYCPVFNWLSEADDFCSFEDREPQPKKGKWIDDKDPFYPYSCHCSVCGGEALTKAETLYDYVQTDFCPNCGADMRGNEDE